MLTIQIPGDTLKKLEKAVADSGRKLPQEIAAAINATATKTQSNINKEVRKELAAPAKVIKKTIKQTRRASKSQLGATVTLSKTSRIPLRDFGARQNNKGVSYKTSPKGGRKTVAGAFQGPKPGLMKASWKGRVFKRVGEDRLPIVQLMGASPWGAFVKNNLEQPTLEETDAELKKQLERRIKFNVLKATGVI